MKLQPHGFIRKRKCGFTLVEVVLALGIVAFAFVPILGLLPVGLDMSRQAIDSTIVSQIAQQLKTEAQQTDFSHLTELEKDANGSIVYYFDDQGNKSPVQDQARAIYKAAFEIAMSTNLPASVTTQKLATAKICILNLTSSRRTLTKSDATDRDNPLLSLDSKKFVVMIPDNGR